MPPYHDYFANYIRLTHGSTVADALEHSTNTCLGVLNGISEDEGDFRYADEKWTIKELLCHVIDTERIMAYRALCFARKEQAALPGYDENAYVVNSFAKVKHADVRLFQCTSVRLLWKRQRAGNRCQVHRHGHCGSCNTPY